MIPARTQTIPTLTVVFVLGLLAASIAPAQSPVDQDKVKHQIEKERDAQRETDQVVRRIATMLSVLEFYGVESLERTRTLEGIAQQLTKLNRGQMNDVIDRLGAAAVADDPKRSAAETVEAYKKHDEIIRTLKRLTGAMESLRGLEQAAAKLEALARFQQKVYLTTSGVIRLEEEKQQIYPKLLAVKKVHTLETDSSLQTVDQAKVEEAVNLTFADIKALIPKLPDEQQQRVQNMEKRLAEMNLVEHVSLAASKLKSAAGPQKVAEWSKANELQKESARDLLELSALLRLQSNTIAEQKAGIQQLNEAIARQDELQKQTKNLQEKIDQLAKEEMAEKANPATPPESTNPEARLLKDVEESLAKFAKLEKKDPSVALQFQAVKQQLEQSLRDMQNANKVRPDFKQLAAEQKKLDQQLKTAEKLGELSREQSRLELDTAKIRTQVEPIGKDLAKELSSAEKNMQSAKNALDKNRPEGAADKQKKAGDELRSVKDALEKQFAKEIKDRDDPLAQLKRFDKELERLEGAQKETRERTRENAKEDDLARKQENLADRAADLKSSPQADQPKTQEALDKASQAMERAAQDLKNKNPAQAQPKQDEALQALQQARKDVKDRIAQTEKRREDIARLEKAASDPDKSSKKEDAKELAKLRAEQIKEEAAAQGKIDTKQARDQVAQALKEAKEASKEIQKAQGNAKGSPAEQQEKLAQKAAEQGLPKEKLEDAANKLKRGMLDEAVVDQEKAANQLDKASKEPAKAAVAKEVPKKYAGGTPKTNEPSKSQPTAKKADPKESKASAECKSCQGDSPKAQSKQQPGEPKECASCKGSSPGQKSGDQKPESEAAKLAKEQRALKDATETLARAKEKNAEAQSALDQVGEAPQALKDQLKEASDNLQKAQKELSQGNADEAAKSQASAEEKLEQALSALSEAAGQPSSQAKAPGEKKPGQGKPKENAMPKQGDDPGQTAKMSDNQKGKGRGDGKEKNTRSGDGNREAKGQNNPGGDSMLDEVTGDSAFLALPPREREMIRQALAGQLPPEYAAEIQQYFINIARGRAAPGVPTAPTGPDR